MQIIYLCVGHLVSFDDFPVALRVEFQCEKKMRLQVANVTHRPHYVSIKDRGVGIGPLSHLPGGRLGAWMTVFQ